MKKMDKKLRSELKNNLLLNYKIFYHNDIRYALEDIPKLLNISIITVYRMIILHYSVEEIMNGKIYMNIYPFFTNQFDVDMNMEDRDVKGGILDYDITSDNEFWWTCPVCHKSEKKSIKDKVKEKECSNCNIYTTSVGHMFPKMLNKWNLDKNKVSPFDIPAKSKTRIHFYCKRCGKEWENKLNDEIMSNKHPKCEKLLNLNSKKKIATKMSEYEFIPKAIEDINKDIELLMNGKDHKARAKYILRNLLKIREGVISLRKVLQ